MDKKSLNDSLKKIEQYVRLLFESMTEYSGDAIPGLMISNSEYGTLFLNDEETRLFRDHVTLLVNHFSSDHMSAVEIERLFKKTILTSLDVKKNSHFSLEKRIGFAIQELVEGLKSLPREYRLYYPVNGLVNSELPQQFGKIKFIVFDRNLVQDYYDQVKDLFQNYTANKKRQIFEHTNKQLAGKSGAVTPVLAIDPVAATNLAIRELRGTIDVINFFSDLSSGTNGFLYLPGERERMATPSLLLSDFPKQYSSIGTDIKGPAVPLSLSTLHKNSRFGFSGASKLLAEHTGEFHGRLLSALQWAGRATTDPRSEEAFLLYAIALESLMLSDNEKDELQYRLALRVAHLIGDDSASKKRIASQVKDLYKIRSQIVHSGKFRVTDSNLQQIRLITKKSILKILGDETFLSIKTPKEFAAWFETKILG